MTQACCYIFLWMLADNLWHGTVLTLSMQEFELFCCFSVLMFDVLFHFSALVYFHVSMAQLWRILRMDLVSMA